MNKLLFLWLVLLLLPNSIDSQTTVFSDNFESGSANWVLEGTWDLTNNQSNSPSFSMTDSPGGSSLDSMDISATMTTGVDLTNILEAKLQFSAIYEIEDPFFDFCNVEVSGDDGIWVNLESFTGINFLPWKEFTYSLDDFIGNTNVKVRFRFFTDNGFTRDGIYIDDVSITTYLVDLTAPTILHESPTFYEGKLGSSTMMAEILDNSGIGSANLFYTVNGGTTEMISGTNESGNDYTFEIPAQTPGAEIMYYLEATDAAATPNSTTTATFSYIAGNHIFYDNGQVDLNNSFGPTSTTGHLGAAVRISSFATNDIVYALIRNHREVNIANSDFEFHIWASNNGTPGADLIPPFLVTPEATTTDNDRMTRIDLSAYASDLSNIQGEVFVGIVVPAAQSFVTQYNTEVPNRSYVLTNSGWILNEGVDFHFRLVTGSVVQPNFCDDAPDLSSLIGQGHNTSVSSPIYRNEDVVPTGTEPSTGWECWGEEDTQGNSSPQINNPLWFTFVGDGEKHRITTTDCGGTAPDYVNNGDTQMALYAGTNCTDLTPVDCDEDADGVPPQGPFPAGLNFQTTAGTVYYLLIDGFIGAGGDFCIEFIQTSEVDCSNIVLGTASTSSIVCDGEVTDISLSGLTVIPKKGLFYGFIWAVHTADVAGSMDPFNLSSWVSNFPLSSSTYVPLLESGINLPNGIYYLTPIVFAEASGSETNWPAVDFSQACMIVGPSLQIEFTDEPPAVLTVTSDSQNEITPPGNNGQANVAVSGGTSNYSFLWENGETTDTIFNLTAGSYFVTVSDASNCVDDVIIEVVVDQAVGLNETMFTEAIKVFPNLVSTKAYVHCNFNETTSLGIQITDNTGRTFLQQKGNLIRSGTIELDLNNLQNGIYFIHFSDKEKRTTQKLVILR